MLPSLNGGVKLRDYLGIIYYLFLSFGILYAWASEKNRRGTLAFFLVASLLAFAYSLLLAWFSLHQLGVLCLLCLTTYLANLVVLTLLPKALQLPFLSIPKFLIQHFKVILLTSVIAAVFSGTCLLFFKGLNPEIHKAHAEISREAYLKLFYSLPQKEMNLPERPFWGNQSAKVTMVEFSDFQCPYCRIAAFTLKPYLKEFRNKIRFVFLNYPLDSGCNPALSQSMHPTACLAAKAGLCAHGQGKFWDYHDEIFENQKRLSRDLLLKLAGKVGLDLVSFDRCLASDETAALLKEDVEWGNRMEVHGTPSLFINGRSFRDWSDPERLRMVIESEIAQTSSSKSP